MRKREKRKEGGREQDKRDEKEVRRRKQRITDDESRGEIKRTRC